MTQLTTQKMQFIADLKSQKSIAVHTDKANEQHYEVCFVIVWCDAYGVGAYGIHQAVFGTAIKVLLLSLSHG